MSDHTEPEDSEFLTELSDQEQETVTGGFDLGGFNFFFFQTTDITSFAERQSNASGNGGNVSGSTSANAGYRFSQTTLAFSSFGRGRRRSLPPMFITHILNLIGSRHIDDDSDD